jgi:hypothetical protein
MKALEVMYALTGLGAVSCFAASFAAHVLLQFYIDHARVKEETGEPGWKVFGSMLATSDFYRPEAQWLWKVRRIGFVGFFIVCGLIVLIAFIAAAFGWQVS